MEDLKVINTSHGKRAIVYQQHYYVRNSSRNDTEYFKCRKFNKGCKAKITLKDGQLYSSNLIHNHEFEVQHIINIEARNEMKNKVNGNPTLPAKQIYNEVVINKRNILQENNNLNQMEINAALPTFENVKKNSIQQEAPILTSTAKLKK
jgi:hypothetical protein